MVVILVRLKRGGIMNAKISDHNTNITEDENYPISRKGRNWALFFLVLIILAVIVPYTLLTEIHVFSGAFLFWSLFAIVSIVCVALISSQWRDVD